VDMLAVDKLAEAGSGVPVAALAPLVLLALAFVGYCWFDLFRHDVRYLPKWAWALICAASVPVGGLVYLLVGREHR
jgi:Phospholipase_D-nuclease N-terminal